MNFIDEAQKVKEQNPSAYPRVSKLMTRYFRTMQTAKKDSTKRNAMYELEAAITNSLKA
jgi:hypothetical protein